MRKFLLFWVLPIGFLAVWYVLSSNDISLGTTFFSRGMHDLVFAIYGNILGVDPAALPPLVIRAVAVDTAVVLGIMAFRRRGKIAALVRAARAAYAGKAGLARAAARPDSLSSAP